MIERQEREALKPCPFCANPRPQAIESTAGDYVECGSCLATMPPHDEDVPDHIARWNTRFGCDAERTAAAAPASVQGWRLVPVEPTEVMLTVGAQEQTGIAVMRMTWPQVARSVWSAMLAAAPQAEPEHVTSPGEEA